MSLCSSLPKNSGSSPNDAKCGAKMQNPKPQVTASLAVPNRRPYPPSTDRRNGARFTKHTIAASPLSKEIPQLSPESHRPSLCARDSVTSRASSVPSTPFDEIPRPLWERTFIRTATTPEAATPDLSIEEITSTRLSLDDEEFFTSLPNGENKQAKLGRFYSGKAFMEIWEDRSGRWKKMRRTLRKIPNGLFARKSRPSTPVEEEISLERPATTDTVLPEVDLVTESCVPQLAKSMVAQELEKENIEPLVVCVPTDLRRKTNMYYSWTMRASQKRQFPTLRRYSKYV